MNVEAIGAGATVRFQIPGRYFRLVETTGPVTVVFFRNGSEIAESQQVEAGYAESFLSSGAGFEFVEIYSATAQTIKFAVRVESTLSYDRAVGNVAVTNFNGAFNVTNAGLSTTAGYVKSINASRRFLGIQNKSAAATAWVRFDGGTASQATGIKIPPGGYFEMSGYVTNQAISAIADAVINSQDFVILEG